MLARFDELIELADEMRYFSRSYSSSSFCFAEGQLNSRQMGHVLRDSNTFSIAPWALTDRAPVHLTTCAGRHRPMDISRAAGVIQSNIMASR